jgi:hypothetical protein
MGYSDDLEHTAALSELIDTWVRVWTRRYVSRRNRQRRNGRNRATRVRQKAWLASEDPTCLHPKDAANADGECFGDTRCTTTTKGI